MKGAGKIFLALALVLVGAVICAGCISTGTSSEQSLEGSWTLNSDETIFITFNPDGSVSGQAPVNGFGGSYIVDGNSLTFGEDFIQTLMAGSPEKMQAEAEFFEALRNTAQWQIADDKLILADAEDKILAIFSASIVGKWDGTDGTSLNFYEWGSFGGYAGLNSIGGEYVVHGDSLVFENMYMTELAGPESVMNKEGKFINALNSVAAFKIYENVLVLIDSDGKTLLTFERHFEPAGEWVLDTDSSVTIIFNGDGTITGQAPVNHYGGKYFITGDSLTFSEGFDKTMMAGSAADMQAETEFFQALGKTAGFTFADGNLVFVDAKGKELLTFERPTEEPTLCTAWVSDSTLVFNEDGTFSGITPVGNTFSGIYTYGGDAFFTMDVSSSTKMAGSPADMTAEAELFKALAAVADYQFKDGGLVLLDAEGQVLLTFA